ncbi:MAG: ATP-binding protein [Myxococcales bacterium]
MRRDSAFLLLAFAAVAAAFFGSTVVAQRSSREIGELAAFIARDAAPGLSAIGNVRGEVRRLQAMVTRQAALGPAPGDKDAIDDTRGSLDAHLAQFRSLPASGEELELLSKLQTNIRNFDEAIERVIVQLGSGKPKQAADTLSGEVRLLADRAVTTATRLVEVDTREAEDAALRIEQAHARAHRVALQMDALCVLLAGFAAWLVVRAVGKARRLQEEHQEIVERRAEELEQFAGRVAHDVLSPLATVGLALAVAQRTGSQTQQSAAQRGAASLQRVRGIVDALLDFARSGARPEPGASADVPAVVGGLLEELRPQAEAAAAGLRVDPIPECTVACSPGVLMIVLNNLIRNAIKYLGDASDRVVLLRVRARRSSVLLEVEDSGPGIPAELGDRIFEPYIRGPRASATRPGIGLGLATVKRLVTAHGGSLGTRPSPLGGASFWVELPRAEASERPAPAADSVMRS